MPDPTPDVVVEFFAQAEPQPGSDDPVALVREAQKDGYQRLADIHSAVADGENLLTKDSRALGALYGAGQGELARMKLFLGDDFAKTVEQAGNTPEALVRALHSGIGNLDFRGAGDILTALPEAKQTTQARKQRREGQAAMVKYKAMLLGVSEGAYQSDNYTVGLDALRAARIDMISHEPRWFTESIAEAVRNADLENPDTCRALEQIIESRLLGFDTDTEREIASRPLDKLRGRELIHAKAAQARKIIQDIALAEQQASEETAFQEKLARGFEGKMDAAVSDGYQSFEEHFHGGSHFMIRFHEYGFGSSALVALTRSPEYQRVNPNQDLRGAAGYLRVLQNVIETPGMLDAMARREADGLYHDPAGRTKDEYMRAGQEEAWNASVRRQILTEIHGNAWGMLLGAVEWEGRGMDEDTRSGIMKKALEVLGGGNATGALVGDAQTRTPEQEMIVRRLKTYIKNPQVKEHPDMPDDILKARLARLKKLGSLAPMADASVVSLRETMQRQALESAEKRAQQMEALQTKVTESGQFLTTLQEAREVLADVKIIKRECQRLGAEGDLKDFVVIQPDVVNKMETLRISVNTSRRNDITKRIQDTETEMHQSPEDYRAKRDELVALRVQAKVYDEIEKLLQNINKTETRNEVRKGFQKKQFAARPQSAFDAIPDPWDDAQWFAYDSDLAAAREKITEPPKSLPREQRAATIERMRQALTMQREAPDLLAIQGEVYQAHQTLSVWSRDAKTAQETLTKRADLAIAGYAQTLIRVDLRQQLFNDNRLTRHG